MNSIDRWKGIGNLIDFKVSLWTGGGIGDCTHHYKALVYFRILRHLKRIFPNLTVVLQIVGVSPGLTRQLFEFDPSIDEIVTAEEHGFMTKHVYEFMSNECSVNKVEYGRFCPPKLNPETVFQRAVNRVYATIRFPRMGTITMDDFFQQMRLDVDDFEYDLAEIFLSEKEMAFGESVASSFGGCEIVGIHWFSKDVSRTCISGEKWIQIVGAFIEAGYGVIVFGAPNERDLHSPGVAWHRNTPSLIKAWYELRDSHSQNVLGLFDESLRKKIAVLKKCKYVVTIEGAIMHLSWLHAIPTLTIVERGPDYFDNPHGYHWAAAAGEPFAKRIICDRGTANDVSPSQIMETLASLDGTKGRRESKIWRDQV